MARSATKKICANGLYPRARRYRNGSAAKPRHAKCALSHGPKEYATAHAFHFRSDKPHKIASRFRRKTAQKKFRWKRFANRTATCLSAVSALSGASATFSSGGSSFSMADHYAIERRAFAQSYPNVLSEKSAVRAAVEPGTALLAFGEPACNGCLYARRGPPFAFDRVSGMAFRTRYSLMLPFSAGAEPILRARIEAPPFLIKRSTAPLPPRTTQ